jgi:hypothetical protein
MNVVIFIVSFEILTPKLASISSLPQLDSHQYHQMKVNSILVTESLMQSSLANNIVIAVCSKQTQARKSNHITFRQQRDCSPFLSRRHSPFAR